MSTNASVFYYVCGDCDCRFESAGLGDMSYGEFICRSEGRSSDCYLSLEDPILDQLLEYLRREPVYNQQQENIRSRLFQGLCSLALDTDSEGARFRIDLMPRCIQCGGRAMRAWDAVTPWRRIQLPKAKHIAWDMLSEFDRQQIVKQFLQRET